MLAETGVAKPGRGAMVVEKPGSEATVVGKPGRGAMAAVRPGNEGTVAVKLGSVEEVVVTPGKVVTYIMCKRCGLLKGLNLNDCQSLVLLFDLGFLHLVYCSKVCDIADHWVNSYSLHVSRSLLGRTTGRLSNP